MNSESNIANIFLGNCGDLNIFMTKISMQRTISE